MDDIAEILVGDYSTMVFKKSYFYLSEGFAVFPLRIYVLNGIVFFVFNCVFNPFKIEVGMPHIFDFQQDLKLSIKQR